MSEHYCENCRFWLGLENEEGICRRRAPSPIVMIQYHDERFREFEKEATWPTVWADQWCGEHEPAPTGTPGDF